MKRPGVTPDTVNKIVGRQPWATLETHLRDAGLEPEAIVPRLRHYAELLVHWNRSVSNLLSRNDEARLVERHIGESLGPIRAMLDTGIQRWLDIGSGGGLPGIPLLLAGVGTHWTLVESRRMKTLFLKKVKQVMALDQLDVVCARIESMEPPADDQAFGGVASRATLHLGPTLLESSRFISTGGSAFLWKGERRDQEMLDDPSWQADWEQGDTLTLAETATVVMRFIKK
jgi:16S rRNA (guanine(527)-N(7))-methyltransferase RsmG